MTSYTRPREGIAGYPGWQVGASGNRVQVVEWKRVGQGQLAVLLEGLRTPEQAAALTDSEIRLPRSELPAPGPGECYLADLIGCDAVDRDGEPLGRVEGFLELPAHPVLVVRGERERLVPLVPDRLVKVEIDARRVTLDWHRDD